MKLLGFGANLHSRFGPPQDTIHAALAALADEGVATIAISRFYVTEPYPPSDQPMYTNCVAQVDTTLPPEKLLALINSVEASFGRVRMLRNEARVIDIDILDYDGMVQADGDALALPHPRMTQRGFVLYPLQEIAPRWTCPVSGQAIAALIAALPDDQAITLSNAA